MYVLIWWIEIFNKSPATGSQEFITKQNAEDALKALRGAADPQTRVFGVIVEK